MIYTRVGNDHLYDMSKLLRYFNPGQTYFITAVTFRRRSLLVEHVDLLKEAVGRVKRRVGFEILAWVVLPDHTHVIIDPMENNLAGIVRRLKLSFANLYFDRQGTHGGTVWQRRYWDHIIRDRQDMNRHIDYIHYNPVKHGLVSDPFAWRHSSLDRYCADGYYSRDWGVKERLTINGEFGE